MHGLRRSGRVGGELWRRLARASVPRAHSPYGDHIEVSKTKQVMYEVIDGKVVRAVHVSTGVTGNTPVGSWRVYRLGPGSNVLGMYYSALLPTRLRDPRLPLGAAVAGEPRLRADADVVRARVYARWGKIGTRILVYP